MRIIKNIFFIVTIVIITSACTEQVRDSAKTGNVIFFHPDGTSFTMWKAARMLNYGPDGMLNWDKLPAMALYNGHTKNSLTSSSHGGATMHAYGVKVIRDSYGLDGKDTITAASGKRMSIMEEAKAAGMATGLVNSGSIIEPGTGCFISRETARNNYESITKQVIQSGVDVIMSGGEEWMLPEGVEGFHCSGKRTDGLNLIKWAEDNGYKVVYNKEELMQLPASTNKVLGVFAPKHTFNDEPEEYLKENNMPNWQPGSPAIGEMIDVALKILSAKDKQFFLVAEEEATDNFPNNNNANGMLEALKRADDAIAVISDYIKKDPKTLLIMAADSDAGGMEILGHTKEMIDPDKPLPDTEENGAPIDGVGGKNGLPFMAAPDQFGNRLPFAISWSAYSDVSGAVIARGMGLNSGRIKGVFDNTDVYKTMYYTLFGVEL